VFDAEELEAVASLAAEHDFYVVTDEIYEHIVYEGTHRCLAADPALRDRVVVVSGFSKTFSVTGWRVGTIIAPPDLTAAIRKVHDFLTVGAPAPLQEACAVGLEALGDAYYDDLSTSYRERRSVMVQALEGCGFVFAPPQGAYYILADFQALDEADDHSFARRLSADAGVAPVPGSSFYSGAGGETGRSLVRFAFCKRLETLERAGERLLRYARAGG
jgi:aminotransferase